MEHIKELHSALPEKPVLFLKPETALLKGNQPFRHPDFSSEIHYEAEIVLKIGNTCKEISESETLQYIESITVGLDLTARDLQQYAKENGLPWEVSKAFDHSAPISEEFIPISHFDDLKNISFHLEVNGLKKQEGNTGLMLNSFERIVSYASRFFTLEKGDLVYTGTPSGVGAIKKGDLLEAFLEGKKMLSCAVV